MWVAAIFESEGEPALELSPVVNIRDVSDGSLVVSSGTMVEKGDGFYGYEFTGYDDSKDYVIRCDSVTLSGTDKYAYTSTEYNELLNAIDTHVVRALGLAQENYCLNNTEYTEYQGATLLTSGTLRTYSDAASVGTDNNVIATYQIASTWSGDELDTYKVVKI